MARPIVRAMATSSSMSSTSPAISPLTASSLNHIRSRLANRTPLPWLLSPVPGRSASPVTGSAATLLALCNLPRREGGVEAGVVLTVRGQELRTHGGEVSLPGGKVDDTDASPEDAALREAHEEIGVVPAQVELLGGLDPMLNRTGKTKVFPFVGVLRPSSSSRSLEADDEPIPPLDVSTLSPLPAHTSEVSLIFSVTLRDLLDPARQRRRNFRGAAGREYVEWDVGDLTAGFKEAGNDGRDGEALSLWGMSAWVMTSFLRTLDLVA